MTAATVLALMLVLGAPGYSLQSAVPLEHDGDYGCAKSSDPGCRRETRAEALRRWLVIAQAIADEATADDGVPDDILANALIITTRAESAWWRSVHLGITRGDNGRSRCLVQRNLGLDDGVDVPESEPGEHWRARDLDGIGYSSTRRCIAVGARILRRHIKWCGNDPACWWCRYGSVSERTDERIMDRVAMYGRIVGQRLHLPPDVRLLLAFGSESTRGDAWKLNTENR